MNTSPILAVAARLTAVALALASAGVAAQATPEAPLIGKCSECHGTNGLSARAGVPHIDGQPEDVLSGMIAALREGKRPTEVRIHREVAESEIAPLAAHYRRQKVQRPRIATRADLAGRGETLYRDRCAQCHLDNGRESDKGAPLMAAQDPGYLVAQMRAFRSGVRKFPYLMDEAYRNLNDDDFAAIAEFFAAQDQAAPEQKPRRRR